MSVYVVVAAIIGSVFLAFAAVLLLYGLGCAIGQVIADWRGFSADYDQAHTPQRIDVSNVTVLHRDPLTVATPWGGDAS